MKTTILYEFTDEDKKLLKIPLPDNPCTNCGAGAACCGCPKGDDYNKKVKPYKDANIYDIAVSLQRITILNNKIKQCLDEITTINTNLPEFCQIDIPEFPDITV